MPRPTCVVIGPNEPPLAEMVREVETFGRDSVAWRDLRLSWVDWHGRPSSYAELLGHCETRARTGKHQQTPTPYHWGELPNLAVYYLTSYLRQRGIDAQPVNNFLLDRDRLDAALAQSPTCVAVTTTFYVTPHPANEVIDYVRSRCPHTSIVLGGPLVANLARRFQGPALEIALEDIDADVFVIEGQGEATLAQVASAVHEGRSLDQTANLVFRRSGRLHRTPAVPEDNPLNDNGVNWTDLIAPGTQPTVISRTARSCAFNCAFCAYPLRAGALALASVDRVRAELDALVEIGGVHNLVFVDDTFNVPLRRFKDLCRLLAEYPFNWYSYFRCSNADEEAVDLMAASGCAGVFLGIESGSPAVLKEMNKATSIDRYRTGIARLKEAGIPAFASYIFGFPGETADTVDETLEFIEETGAEWFRVQPWYHEPDTPISARADEFGLHGFGFGWRHDTMDAAEAMAHVETAFLEITASRWLPQWSFDFWMLPYLAGRSRIEPEDLAPWLDATNDLLRLELRGVRPDHPEALACRDRMVAAAGYWSAPAGELVGQEALL